MRKERTIRVPSFVITRDSANRVLDIFRSMNPNSQKYVFLARHSNVVFDQTDEIVDLPLDVNMLRIKIEAPDRFTEVILRTKFANFFEALNWENNQIIIQGEDISWVNDTYRKFEEIIEKEKRGIRSFIYINLRTFFWLTVSLVLLAEYSIAISLFNGFDVNAPLTGKSAILIILIPLFSFFIVGNFFIPIFSYLFPYFEIENNLSKARTEWRNVINVALVAIYGAAVINGLCLIFNPILKHILGR